MEQRRRGCRNSQAKGPVSDGTLESRKAPKKQSASRRIFQVSDRGTDRHRKCLRVPLFFCCGDEENGHHVWLTGHLTIASQNWVHRTITN